MQPVHTLYRPHPSGHHELNLRHSSSPMLLQAHIWNHIFRELFKISGGETALPFRLENSVSVP